MFRRVGPARQVTLAGFKVYGIYFQKIYEKFMKSIYEIKNWSFWIYEKFMKKL